MKLSWLLSNPGVVMNSRVQTRKAKFNELSRTKVFDGESRTTAVFLNGLIYCRSAAGDVTCLDVREEQ